MIPILKIIGIVLSIPFLALVLFYFWASSGSYPQDKYAEIISEESDREQNNEKDDTFAVVSYNLGYLSGLTNNTAKPRTLEFFEKNLNAVIQALKPLKIDAIALQEIDLNSQRSFNINQVDKLARGLGMKNHAIAVNWDKNYVPFPYFPFSAHFGRLLSGQAILSCYPIQEHDRIVLEKVVDNPFYYNAFYLDRLAQIVRLKVRDETVILINVHLEAFDKPTRRKQTQFLQQLLAKYQEYPILLMGDFNSPPPSPEHPQPTISLLLDLRDLVPVVQSDRLLSQEAKTFPADDPIAKIDYIFYSRDRLELLEWRVVREARQASDHLPLMARFRLIP
ncbi:MAG: endonuclease/exonuclease/phosphatase family protein [Cyanobacteria bacterium SBLK]|nr:endonuclease/exonuclease/phosphatase family protein [Cyanobacteria bacterium SBLK]